MMVSRFLQIKIECAGGKQCPYNGWLHLTCVGLKEINVEELDKMVFYCDSCKARLQTS